MIGQPKTIHNVDKSNWVPQVTLEVLGHLGASIKRSLV